MIERAAIERDPAAALEHRFHTLPPRVRTAINRNRNRAGLRPFGGRPAPASSGPIFRWDDRSPYRPGAPRTSVLLVACHGRAVAAAVGRQRDERIAHRAFGSAEQLNESRGWFLRDGHDGLPIELMGPDLRAIDSVAGLIVEWLPDMSRRRHIELVDAIERGKLVPSVAFSRSVRQTYRPPLHDCEYVTSGVLQHIGLVRRGAYSGAVAQVFRNQPSTPENRRKQIDAVVRFALARASRLEPKIQHTPRGGGL